MTSFFGNIVIEEEMFYFHVAGGRIWRGGSMFGRLRVKAVVLVLLLITIGSVCALVSMHVKNGGHDPLVSLYRQNMTSAVQIQVNVSECDYWTGSGVFIERDLILTAGHVLVNDRQGSEILELEHIKVRIYDGTMLDVVDYYAEDYTYADIGVVRVKVPDDFHPHISNIDLSAEVGERLFAIGAPFGLYPTLTHGIVSQVNVDFMDTASLLTQTDCPLNPGNSGCPMYDMDGDLIGIYVASSFVVRQSCGLNFFETMVTAELVLDKWRAISAVEDLFIPPPPPVEPNEVEANEYMEPGCFVGVLQ